MGDTGLPPQQLDMSLDISVAKLLTTVGLVWGILHIWSYCPSVSWNLFSVVMRIVDFIQSTLFQFIELDAWT